MRTIGHNDERKKKTFQRNNDHNAKRCSMSFFCIVVVVVITMQKIMTIFQTVDKRAKCIRTRASVPLLFLHIFWTLFYICRTNICSNHVFIWLYTLASITDTYFENRIFCRSIDFEVTSIFFHFFIFHNIIYFCVNFIL